MSADDQRKYAKKTRGKPFQSGNSGRPRGSRNRATIAVEALLADEAHALTRKAVQMALSGNAIALRLCLDRIAPARRDALVEVDLPPIDSAANLLKAGQMILSSVSGGFLTPSEGEALMGLLDKQRRMIETFDLENRIAILEARV